MAKVDFPNSPSDGDTVVVSGSTFIYSSAKSNWSAVSNVSRIGVSDLTVGSDLSASGSGDLTYSTATGAPVLTYTPPVVPSQHSTTVYATAGDLPLAGNVTGNQAFVTSTNRLYLWDGAGWYNIALVNVSPTITTGSDATYTLATDGTATVITLAATDPDGEDITWGYAVTVGALGSTATVSQADNEFTITPSTTDGGTFSLTFTASNEINTDTSTSAFTLAFGSPVLQGTLLTTIYNPSPSSTDNFGDRNNLMNDLYYVVSSWQSGNDASNVRLFNRSNGNLAYTITQPGNTNRIGFYGAISGNYLVLADIAATKKLYVYDISTFSSSTITSANYTINDPDYNGGKGGQFGKGAERISISGNYIVAGDFNYTSGSDALLQQGIAYVFDISTFASSTITSANYILTNPDIRGSTMNDRFGYATAINGNKIAVGSREESTGGSQSDGVVYVYDISNFSSSVISSADFSIDNPDYGGSNDGGDFHGDRVAISQDYIAVGARYEDSPFYTAGAIYIYDVSNGNLLYTVASPSASAVANQWFGYSLDLDGDNLYGQVYAGATWTIYHYDISSFTSSTPAVIAAGTGIENTLSAPANSGDFGGGGNFMAYDGKLIVGARDASATNGSGGTLTSSGVAYVYE